MTSFDFDVSASFVTVPANIWHSLEQHVINASIDSGMHNSECDGVPMAGILNTHCNIVN